MSESFLARLDRRAPRDADAIALIGSDGVLTRGALARRAAALAQALAAEGVRAGDRLAVAIGGRCAFVVALLAGLRLGASVTPLNPRLMSRERDEILAHLGPKRVVGVGEVEAAGGGPGAEPEAAGDPGEHLAVGRFAPPARPAGSGLDPQALTPPAVILYTSGSTGQPKGACLSHRALGFAIESWVGPIMGLTSADVVLAALPLAHSLGLCGGLLAPLLAGAAVVLLDPFTPEDALSAIARHRVTVLPGVATMFRRLLDAPDLAAADLRSLRLAVSGAAPCPWALAQEWQRRTGVRILRGYGMTELFRPISYLADDPTDLPDAVGRPVPGVEVRVVDDAGAPASPGETGELWIRTPAAMDGYLDAPAETARMLRDGWFRTGDLASLSPEGFVRVVGRQRELILRGGYSVVPGEVEAVLLAHSAVAEAAVVGVTDAELGEEIVAFVALRPGAATGPAQLIAHCRAHLAGFKAPRQVTILPRLPRGPTGKVRKAELVTGAEASAAPGGADPTRSDPDRPGPRGERAHE